MMENFTDYELLTVMEWMMDKAEASVKRKPPMMLNYQLAEKLHKMAHDVYYERQKGTA
jgi:hypothetical protein